MTACPHEWEPCPGWTGRYRCVQCKALGYRRLVGGKYYGHHGNDMILYLCTKRGCKAGAVHRDGITNPKRQRCAQHAED